jgi:hypothetical protein
VLLDLRQFLTCFPRPVSAHKLSAAGAWGIGVTLDGAGGPQTASGWSAAFAVMAAGIALGPSCALVVAHGRRPATPAGRVHR